MVKYDSIKKQKENSKRKQSIKKKLSNNFSNSNNVKSNFNNILKNTNRENKNPVLEKKQKPNSNNKIIESLKNKYISNIKISSIDHKQLKKIKNNPNNIKTIKNTGYHLKNFQPEKSKYSKMFDSLKQDLHENTDLFKRTQSLDNQGKKGNHLTLRTISGLNNNNNKYSNCNIQIYTEGNNFNEQESFIDSTIFEKELDNEEEKFEKFIDISKLDESPGKDKKEKCLNKIELNLNMMEKNFNKGDMNNFNIIAEGKEKENTNSILFSSYNSEFYKNLFSNNIENEKILINIKNREWKKEPKNILKDEHTNLKIDGKCINNNFNKYISHKIKEKDNDSLKEPEVFYDIGEKEEYSIKIMNPNEINKDNEHSVNKNYTSFKENFEEASSSLPVLHRINVIKIAQNNILFEKERQSVPDTNSKNFFENSDKIKINSSNHNIKNLKNYSSTSNKKEKNTNQINNQNNSNKNNSNLVEFESEMDKTQCQFNDVDFNNSMEMVVMNHIADNINNKNNSQENENILTSLEMEKTIKTCNQLELTTSENRSNRNIPIQDIMKQIRESI